MRTKTSKDADVKLDPSAQAASRERIAIVGIGCRFPGANGPDAFWRLLTEEIDAIREAPQDRFDADDIYDPRPGIPGKISSRMGGFLDHVEEFDASFFHISPREALKMDPQQRNLLEVAWEALEYADRCLKNFMEAPRAFSSERAPPITKTSSTIFALVKRSTFMFRRAPLEAFCPGESLTLSI